MRTDVCGNSYLHYKQTLEVLHSSQSNNIHVFASTIQQGQLFADK
jgi:hypothetical protein